VAARHTIWKWAGVVNDWWGRIKVIAAALSALTAALLLVRLFLLRNVGATGIVVLALAAFFGALAVVLASSGPVARRIVGDGIAHRRGCPADPARVETFKQRRPDGIEVETKRCLDCGAASYAHGDAPGPATPLVPESDALTALRMKANQLNLEERARVQSFLDEKGRLIRRAYALRALLEEPDTLHMPTYALTLPKDVRFFAREARGFVTTSRSFHEADLLNDVLEDAMLEGDSRIDLLRVVKAYLAILEGRSAAT
jgi:hypothetical protein